MCILITFKCISSALLLFILYNYKYCATTPYHQTSSNQLRNLYNQGGGNSNSTDYRQFHNHPNFHDHQHNHHHHFHNHGNYYGPFSRETYQGSSNKPSFIPVDVFQAMDNYTEVDDLLRNFVEGYVLPPALIESRFDGSNVIRAKCAKCEPELQIVEIVTEDDPNIVYIPNCVRIERCGGCCNTKLVTCQPIKFDNVTYELQKLESFTKGKFKKFETVRRTVKKHTKCKCQCKIKETDCTRFQVYNRSACRCMCPNFDEERRCLEENATKIWEPDTCSCQCRDINECSTGFIFDLITCRCVPFRG